MCKQAISWCRGLSKSWDVTATWTQTPCLAEDVLTSAVGGINWYISGHEHKVQFDYGVITTRLSAADTGTGAASLIENRARLQYTIVF